MLRIVHLSPVLVGLLIGCGGSTSQSPGNVARQHAEATLREVADMYRLYDVDSKGKSPAKEKDFAKYEMGLPLGYEKIKNGSVVIVWGASLKENASDKVLAFEKQAPESGGLVLMQDGTTIQELTAEQFKSAPKADESQ